MLDPTSVPYDPLYPQPWYRSMCEHMPVRLNEQQMWDVFGYEEVQQILLDPVRFSSRVGYGRGMTESMLTSDPPRHHQLRDLVSQRFTPRLIARLEERIRAIVHELLDAVLPARKMDIVEDLAYPLPTIVIAELLGIPAGDREQFRTWSDALLEQTLPPARAHQIEAEMSGYFLQVMEQRLRKPEHDLISELLKAEIEGERLSRQELLGFCHLLLVAGNETTTNLIGNMMLCFDEFPEAFQAVRADPELLPGAIEEVLRYRSPTRLAIRVAAADVALAGCQIKAGQPVVLWVAAANCDERVFPNATTFDIHRTPQRHIAFGHGIHYCLGAPLARLEARIAFTVLCERLSEIQRMRWIPLEPLQETGTQGVRHLPMTFVPSRSHRSLNPASPQK